jgi:hypothetical protein
MTLPRLGPIWVGSIVGGLLLCFAALSFTAVMNKSATYDEPEDVVGGMVHRYLHDFRINPEDPPLFGWWASLPHSMGDLPIDTSNRFYTGCVNNINLQWGFVVWTLFENDSVNAQHFLLVSRGMFLVLGIALGVVIACWAYQIGGAWAAIVATLLFCFDPNFLAHSSLVKNDVPLALMMCLLGFFIWRFGRDGAWHWLGLAAIACGIGFNVKFSAVLFGPILIALLLIRANLREPWTVGGRFLENWRQRGGLIFLGVLATFAAIFFVTWCSYGFHFSATADGQPLATTPIIRKSVRNRILNGVSDGQLRDKSAHELDVLEESRMKDGELEWPVRLDLWMLNHHLLPEGWLFGFLFTYANTLRRAEFLMGSVGYSGWWYYFPLAILFKTPTATLIAALVIAPFFVLRWLLVAPTAEKDGDPAAIAAMPSAWNIIVLALPPITYFLAAATSNLNLGLRHILPIYPYLFISLGVGAVRLMRRSAAPTLVMCAALLVGLLAETIWAYPNFIPFFNLPSHALGDRLSLLGDSNLDWGQDLPALAEWQKQNPGQKLYFRYFGTADPLTYGVHYVNLAGGWPFARTVELNPANPGVLAISATHLQGIYLRRDMVAADRVALEGEQPFKVLNGTIYLYHWPPHEK